MSHKSDQSDSIATRQALSRRGFVALAGALGALPAGGLAFSQTPSASPSSSPIASPAASPVATPQPIPEHSLRIVQDETPAYGDPVPGGDLRMYVNAEGFGNINPVAQRQDMTILMSVYDPLVAIDPATLEPRPALAESWEWSPDGRTLTFSLRPDVVFHDGSDLTAEDIRFSLIAYRDDYDSMLAGMFAMISDVAAPDARTVVVSFIEPDGAFLFNGASMPMFSRAQFIDAWESLPEGERGLSEQSSDGFIPNGTGPWRVDEAGDDRMRLVPNDAWWATPPHADSLILIAEDDVDARLAGWKSGDVDLLEVSAGQLDTVWDEEGTLYAMPSSTTFFMAFNFMNPANATADMMADPALREAISLCIDRERLADDIFHTFLNTDVASTIVQPWARDESFRNPAQNIERARTLLEDAGWVTGGGDIRYRADGNVLDLWIIVSNDAPPELRAILQSIGDDLRQIGAKLTVQELAPEDFDPRWVENRQYDMIAYSLTSYAAFYEFDLYGSGWDINANARGWNPGGYRNESVDDAIAAWFAASEQSEMQSAMDGLQAGLKDDPFGIWFGAPDTLVLVKPGIQGFEPGRFLPMAGTAQLWFGDDPVATPQASPIAPEPEATPDASPVASPVR